MDKYGQCRHGNVLHPPGSLHHGTKVVIVVDGRADSRVVIQKFIPSYLQNQNVLISNYGNVKLTSFSMI